MSNKNKYYTEIDHLISSFSFNKDAENFNNKKQPESHPQSTKKIISIDYQVYNPNKSKEQQSSIAKKSRRRSMIIQTEDIEPKPMNDLSRNRQLPSNNTPSNRIQTKDTYHNILKEKKNYSIDISSKRFYNNPIKTHVPNQLSTLTNSGREHYQTETNNTIENEYEDTTNQSNLPIIHPE